MEVNKLHVNATNLESMGFDIKKLESIKMFDLELTKGDIWKLKAQFCIDKEKLQNIDMHISNDVRGYIKETSTFNMYTLVTYIHGLRIKSELERKNHENNIVIVSALNNYLEELKNIKDQINDLLYQ